MSKYTKEQLWKMYSELPENLQKEMSSDDNSETIRKIGNNHKLNEEKKSLLVKYVGFVMLGILPPEKFSETIKKDLKLTKPVADEIYQGINRVIFFTN
jgi:hypothetical protein